MKKYLYYICVLLGAACWGMIGLFSRGLAAMGLDAFQRTALRMIGAMVVLTVVLALLRPAVFRIKLRHTPLFIAAGLLSVQGMTITSFFCQNHCSLAVSGVLLYLAPTFVVLMSAVLWKAPITRRKVAAMLLAFLGSVLVSGIMGGGSSVSLFGIAMGVASGFCYATYTIFAHYALEHYDSMTMTYWTFFFAALCALLYVDFPALGAAMVSGGGLFAAFGLVVISTVLPYLLYTKGLEGVESGRAAIMANVEPVVGALVGVIAFQEAMSIWVILGVAAMLWGVGLLAKE